MVKEDEGNMITASQISPLHTSRTVFFFFFQRSAIPKSASVAHDKIQPLLRHNTLDIDLVGNVMCTTEMSHISQMSYTSALINQCVKSKRIAHSSAKSFVCPVVLSNCG